MDKKPHKRRLPNAAILLYRQLLRCYPSEFRGSYAAGMERMFREHVAEACGNKPIRSLVVLLAREFWGILRTAPVQRIARIHTRRPVKGHRSEGWGSILSVALGDVRYAFRTCVRRPTFTLIVIAQLGIGIGATTAIVSVVDNVLFRELPYPHADELVVFGNPGHSPPLYTDWRSRTNSFSAVAAVWNDGRGFGISGEGAPESVSGARVTSEFFQMFGARALHGRLLIDADFDGTPPAVAVVSHGLLQRRWGGFRGGITITVDGNPTEVVGVLDPAFQAPDEVVESGVDVWLPLDLEPGISQARTWNVLRVVGRKRAGVSTEAAQLDVDALADALAAEYPRTDRLPDGSRRLYPLIPLLDAMVGDVDNYLYTLLGAVGMMLLIAWANVASLFVARETGRTREMALRAALGAGRGRIFAQLLTEGVLLALISGALGVVLAVVGVSAFEMFYPDGIPRLQHISVDARALCFAFLAAVASAVLFAIAPVFASPKSAVAAALRTTESGVTAARKALSLRKMLVVAEVAIGLMLVVGAGLLFHSFMRLRNVNGGFEPEHVLAMPLELGSRFSVEQRLQFTRDLMDRINAISGVETAGAGSTLPPYNHGKCCWFGPVRTDAGTENPPFAMLHPITPKYFETLGATILRGRGISDTDNNAGSTPTVINETLARMLFGATNPLDKGILVGGSRWTVVGVVNDISHWGLNRESGANAYVPHTLLGGPFTSLEVAVRSQVDPAVLSSALRDAVWAIDADLPIREIAKLKYRVASSVAQPRFLSILVTTFAVLATILAAGGIYGFMAYTVRQRHREFGIRIALGASRGDLTRMVFRSVLLLTLIGSAFGLVGALALSRTLRSVLYEITPTDPITFAVSAALLISTALVAAYLPAHTATKTDPVETLRIE